MKTMGVVGGVAWPSTIVYYRTINELVAQRLGGGGLHCARLVLAQTDFEEVERRQREGRWDLVGELLAAEGDKVKAAGADSFCWPATRCTVLTRSSSRPSISRSCTSSVRSPDASSPQGYRMVGLLGSHYTMRGTYFVRRLEQRYGLTVLTVEGEHADNVQNALYRELAKGVFLPETRAKFAAAIADLVP
jgi:aspartate racemase